MVGFNKGAKELVPLEVEQNASMEGNKCTEEIVVTQN